MYFLIMERLRNIHLRRNQILELNAKFYQNIHLFYFIISNLQQNFPKISDSSQKKIFVKNFDFMINLDFMLGARSKDFRIKSFFNVWFVNELEMAENNLLTRHFPQGMSKNITYWFRANSRAEVLNQPITTINASETNLFVHWECVS